MSTQALKLFVLKDDSGAVVTDNNKVPLYFTDKMKAKDHKWLIGNTKWTVANGPDHHKTTGDKT
jgi:hypothetical protein